MPESGPRDLPEEAVKWYTSLPGADRGESQGSNSPMVCTGQDFAPAEKQAMKWFSDLETDAQTSGRGQTLGLSQSELQAAISAYASLSLNK